MIKEIWIIERTKGISLIHRSYSTLQTNPDLLSSFLSGLYSFSEVELKKIEDSESERLHGIDSIEMAGFKWVYLDGKKSILYIIAADKDDNVDILKKQAQIIRQNFLHFFNIKDEKDFARLWDGNISKFEGKFYDILEELIENWQEIDNVIVDIAKKMDLIEVYQQFFLALGKILKYIPSEETLIKLKNKMINFINQHISNSITGIEYQLKTGLDILSINPKELQFDTLRDNLQLLLKQYYTSLKSLTGDKIIFHINKQFVFPLILKELNRLKDLNLDESILNLLLNF